LDQARADGQARDEGRRVRKDGSRFWANAVITAVYEKGGRLEGFAKGTRDETERQRVEEQARLREIFAECDRIANELLATVVRQLVSRWKVRRRRRTIRTYASVFTTPSILSTVR
ncbi:MAG TPA: PAS domain S-box protein, partial [Acidothermaceae bacterium]